MRVIVLGAGVVGVASAWYLSAAGHAVTVIERRPAAALETSFANGGQISPPMTPPPTRTQTAPSAIKRQATPWLLNHSSPRAGW